MLTWMYVHFSIYLVGFVYLFFFTFMFWVGRVVSDSDLELKQVTSHIFNLKVVRVRLVLISLSCSCEARLSCS